MTVDHPELGQKGGVPCFTHWAMVRLALRDPLFDDLEIDLGGLRRSGCPSDIAITPVKDGMVTSRGPRPVVLMVKTFVMACEELNDGKGKLFPGSKSSAPLLGDVLLESSISRVYWNVGEEFEGSICFDAAPRTRYLGRLKW